MEPLNTMYIGSFMLVFMFGFVTCSVVETAYGLKAGRGRGYPTMEKGPASLTCNDIANYPATPARLHPLDVSEPNNENSVPSRRMLSTCISQQSTKTLVARHSAIQGSADGRSLTVA